MSVWGHDELAHDLALLKANGNRVVFENIPMGAAMSERPDVYCISKSFTDPRPTTFEIKVTRSDFLQDVKKGKWKVYKSYSEQVFFACPDGLISPDEVPKECGLIVRKKKAWRVVKQAPRSFVNKFDECVVVKLLIATHSGERCTDGGYRKHLENKHNAVEYIGNTLGQDVAEFYKKSDRLREYMEAERGYAKRIIEAARKITGTACWQGGYAVLADLEKMNFSKDKEIL